MTPDLTKALAAAERMEMGYIHDSEARQTVLAAFRELVQMARAEEIMVRRLWCVSWFDPGWGVVNLYGELPPELEGFPENSYIHDLPKAALIAADDWYVANVERGKNAK